MRGVYSQLAQESILFIVRFCIFYNKWRTPSVAFVESNVIILRAFILFHGEMRGNDG